jgi:hypothetical protein
MCGAGCRHRRGPTKRRHLGGSSGGGAPGVEPLGAQAGGAAGHAAAGHARSQPLGRAARFAARAEPVSVRGSRLGCDERHGRGGVRGGGPGGTARAAVAGWQFDGLERAQRCLDRTQSSEAIKAKQRASECTATANRGGSACFSQPMHGSWRPRNSCPRRCRCRCWRWCYHTCTGWDGKVWRGGGRCRRAGDASAQDFGPRRPTIWLTTECQREETVRRRGWCIVAHCTIHIPDTASHVMIHQAGHFALDPLGGSSRAALACASRTWVGTYMA